MTSRFEQQPFERFEPGSAADGTGMPELRTGSDGPLITSHEEVGEHEEAEELMGVVVAAAAERPDQHRVTAPVPEREPQPETDQGDSDRPPVHETHRAVEIYHGAFHDVAVNRTHPDQALANEALAVVQEGIPASWPVVETAPHRAYYQDSEHAPRLTAKPRHGVSAESYAEGMAGLAQRTGLSDADVRARAADIRAAHSLLNELHLAPQVQAVVQSQQIQSFAHELGFAGVSVVEPLVGLIDRRTGSQVMVYPWQDGDPPMDLTTGEVMMSQAEVHGLTSLVEEIGTHLVAADINPRDFDIFQTLVEHRDDGSRHVHLIDIKRFRRGADSD